VTVAQNILHGSCVAVGDAGVLILGASGSGKSGLAIRMIARGAALVADDRVVVSRDAGTLVAGCPESIAGMIEARNLGILNAPAQATARIEVVVDLDQPEPDRLPQRRTIALSGVEVDLVFGKDTPNLADALMLLLRNGRYA